MNKQKYVKLCDPRYDKFFLSFLNALKMNKQILNTVT